jgi:hypothetical protein
MQNGVSLKKRLNRVLAAYEGGERFGDGVLEIAEGIVQSKWHGTIQELVNDIAEKAAEEDNAGRWADVENMLVMFAAQVLVMAKQPIPELEVVVRNNPAKVLAFRREHDG